MEMWQMVQNITKNFKIETAIDVGAHIGGFYEKVLSPFAPLAKVYFFEPTVYNFDRLRTKYQEPQFKCYNYAVSDVCGIADFYMGKDNPDDKFNGMGNTLTTAVRPNYATEIERVNVTTLNKCFEDGLIPQPDFMKIDAQGVDLQVIKGASLLLPKTKFILAEFQTNDISSGIIFMESAGWRLYNISIEKGWPSQKGRLGECNIMFYNKELIGNI